MPCSYTSIRFITDNTSTHRTGHLDSDTLTNAEMVKCYWEEVEFECDGAYQRLELVPFGSSCLVSLVMNRGINASMVSWKILVVYRCTQGMTAHVHAVRFRWFWKGSMVYHLSLQVSLCRLLLASASFILPDWTQSSLDSQAEPNEYLKRIWPTFATSFVTQCVMKYFSVFFAEHKPVCLIYRSSTALQYTAR